jgi:HPt (histidine-containing phosphotransfer) domain-containing protein
MEEIAADVPPSPPPPPDRGLDLIAGLDTVDCLRRVLGRREAYVGLLRRFAVGQAGVIRDIRAALADGRRDDAERGAHTLKGVAGTIGAGQLQREAGDVEAALRHGAMPQAVAPLLDRAERSLDDLITALLHALPAESPVAPAATRVDAKALAAAVAGLDELLSSDAAEAIDAFEAAKPLLAAAFGDRSAQIETLVRGYRFEDALTALRKMARD